MSSNIRLNRICKHCNKIFIAKTKVTNFCSDQCAKNNYKKRQKEGRIEISESDTHRQIAEGNVQSKGRMPESVLNEMVAIGGVSELTSLSERTIFRLLKDPAFPRIKVGKRLLFKKKDVLDYLTSKYGNV